MPWNRVIRFLFAVVCVMLGSSLLYGCSAGPARTPTPDAREAIRAEQSVRDIVIPSLQRLSQAASEDVYAVFAAMGYSQMWFIRVEPTDWQTEQADTGDYRVTVRVEYSDECRAGDGAGCAWMRESMTLAPNQYLPVGCTSRAEFRVLLDETVTVVPSNQCAETIYYVTKP